MKRIPYLLSLFILSLTMLAATCRKSLPEPSAAIKQEVIEIEEDYARSPILSPVESMASMELEPGFSVSLVASEPLLNTPVAMEFDEKGRIWVVEMEAYMKDTVGTGEDRPSGKIVVLQDRNGDGRMDERKVVIDSLVLPRAFALIEDGILVAEPPRLWYYQLKNDKPVKKTLVDAAYAEGGNVEHQPNGLLRALDNWIYNAKSSKRYRKDGDKWLIEKTHFRGQWGITQDEYGRLLYNNNSENLQGDFFMPGLGAGNKNQEQVSGFSKRIVPNNRVYPLRPTTGVNRGYMDGILSDGLKLVNFTAACSPVVYNGEIFGSAYYGNIFVAEPSANLIKRNILSNKGYTIEGSQAYKDREFVRSIDERFRPVSLLSGPDGALYVVDMYRGIIQHKTYLTPYLKSEIRKRDLNTPTSFGRIYKVLPEGKQTRIPVFAKHPDTLIKLLKHPNGWVRNKAQQLLIDGKYKELSTRLLSILKESDDAGHRIRALWTMEGLDVLKADDILPLLSHPTWELRMQALSAVPSLITVNNYKSFLSAFNLMIEQDDRLALPYIAFLMPQIRKFDAAEAERSLWNIAGKANTDVYVADAVISNLQGSEDAFLKKFTASYQDPELAITKRLKRVIDDINKTNTRPGNDKEFPKGVAIYASVCGACHGPAGQGVRNLAPPLNNSEWVTGNKDRLAAVVLYGLSGPVTVDGKLYTAPEISGEMPGIAGNPSFSDADVAEVLNYVRTSWANQADRVSAAQIKAVRDKYKGREKAFRAEDFQ